MIAMTTNSSMSVKPRWRPFGDMARVKGMVLNLLVGESIDDRHEKPEEITGR